MRVSAKRALEQLSSNEFARSGPHADHKRALRPSAEKEFPHVQELPNPLYVSSLVNTHYQQVKGTELSKLE